jgi:sodium/hydrogen antiporter
MSSIAVLSAVAIGFALTSRRLERWSIGGPVLFLVTGVVLGPALVDVLDPPLGGSTVQGITELTLAILLFADASTLGVRTLRGSGSIPLRLLSVGLPLAILAGAVLGHWLLAGLTWGLAFLVSSVLAPTDAALSLGVMTSPLVPERIRTSLNVESGLNDGIATPFVSVFIAVVAAEEQPGHQWVLESLREIAIAIVVAAIIGGLGAWLGVRATRRSWTSGISPSLLVLALALLSYTASDAVGGNGFVAAFLAGLVFALVSRDELQVATEFTETTGVFMSYIVWALFGALLLGPLLTRSWDLRAVGFAVLVLTVARMVPVALALVGSGLPRRHVALIGWFGPRGLASIVFLMHSMHELHLDSSYLQDRTVEAVVWTIGLSVLAHGLTSGPLIPRLGRAVGARRVASSVRQGRA